MLDSDPGVRGLVPGHHEGSFLKPAQGWEDSIPLIDRVADTEKSCLLGLPEDAAAISGGCNDRIRATLFQKRALLNLLCLQWPSLKSFNSSAGHTGDTYPLTQSLVTRMALFNVRTQH